ncbi:MAG: glutamine-hydrolyzing GMP synthase [Candidatus Scalindua sp. AMX11]|nr:MAG: glutamine-hydrolyzing GMP synthase [Candidatus Scalindua sp.]NOG82360.1 glutamine-hydrolyzing GMP synthase [Planctomycetota bacterium]RZV70563.1 MAG: glutamine-hydrolyzing GMP synthase [Candidatus Scalindua sp. SCAELEC01]TDE64206.1 MAG: glutamine-hydrolyzing GMP synthase [Candidatus Scalindua sp. AMX11]GJQ59684.1 MAG: GMP synthase [glutamine-hydrolyzing] [Candidatus Scalindua sp.]
MQNETHENIVVIDFGSQYSHLIARRIREHNVYSKIVPYKTSIEEIKQLNPKGIILSGGPASVSITDAPRCDEKILFMDIPILGICYGLQLGSQILGASVRPSKNREYGRSECRITDHSLLLGSLDITIDVWMSHGDQVAELPDDFESLAYTENCPFAAVKHKKRDFYGVQFHPEVTHTPSGKQILHNFLFQICQCTGDWKMSSYIDSKVNEIREQVKDERVICGLSGGVDSAVAAALIYKAIGPNLSCVLVDNGLLRSNESDDVVNAFKESFKADLLLVDAGDRFLSRLSGVVDPEQKRKIIGHEFIAVFKEESRKLADIKFLAQGTLYPDIIESVAAHGGPTATIKSHHNVGALPAELGFELVEPLKELFKDEVRHIGLELGLPEEIIWRHPFPGPGLAIRIIGEITEERIAILRNADDIMISEIKSEGLYREIAQAFAVLLPVSSVGVMGDQRTYENVIALRSVNTHDYMTADWTRLPHELLARISNRIINEVRGINRVVYDISSKPPSTIEWE